MRRLALTVLAGIGIAVAGMGGCIDDVPNNCDNARNCPVDDAGGSNDGGGTGGTGQDGGGSGGTSGGSSGTGGSGGTSASGGTSGTSGTGGTLPCNGACSGTTPVCNEVTDQCVQCSATNGSACSGTTPVCKAATNTCVACTGNSHCTGEKRFCDTTTNTCVQCLASTACATPTASRCDAGECKPCTTHADCAHITGKNVCDAGECVQCTGKNYAACGTDPTSMKPRVCDSRARTCTTNQERATGLCGACVSDAQCQLGQRCIVQRFGTPAQDVGYFCFWKKGDTAKGAAAICETQGRPYVRTLVNATTIDGETADVCGLRASTCVARNQFSSKDCTTGDAGTNSLCGFDAPNDATCVPFGVSGTFRCTMRCLSSDDCPVGSSCNTQAAEPHCEL